MNTRRLLVEEGGFLYDSDAYNDELPYWVEVGGRAHLVVPYSLGPNDVKFARGGQYTVPDEVPNNGIRGMFRYSYPNVHFFGDKVYIDHDHFFRPSIWASKEQRRDVYQKLHILPLEWLYS